MTWSAGLFLLWCWQVRLSFCYTYELRAHVTLRDEDYENADLVVGDFADYGRESTEKTKGRLVPVDETYGCPGSNATLEAASGAFIVVLPLSNCNDYLQAKKAAQERAIGVVFYHTSNRDEDLSSGDEDLSIPVAVIKVGEAAVGRITGRDSPPYYSVEVEGKLYPVVPQQRTFYFIVTAFCILILLSCLWFFTSYFRRCRHSIRDRRRQAKAKSSARKAISKLKVRSYKTSKGSQETESCAVCLELYSNNDVIRVLPCRHEFHKNCVDPWLKLKCTCPLCKCNITTDSSPSSTSAEETESHETAPTLTSPSSSPSTDTLASSSISSSSGDSSSSETSSTLIQLQDMRLLATPQQLAITLDEVEPPATRGLTL